MKIGERYQLPDERCCGHVGTVVYVSPSGKTIGVKCMRKHYTNPLNGKKFPEGSSFYDEYVENRRSITYLLDV